MAFSVERNEHRHVYISLNDKSHSSVLDRVLVISDVASNASNSRGVQYNVHCNASIIEIYKYTLLANYNKIMLHRAISRNKECNKRI